MARVSEPTAANSRGGESRKQIRKQAKQFKKLGKVAFAQKKSLEKVIIDKYWDPDMKKKRKKKSKSERKAARLAREAAGEETPKKEKKNKKKGEQGEEDYEQIKKEMERERRNREREMAKKEQKEIDKYAKKLGYKNKKADFIPSSFVNEGLDYLLEICDRSKREAIAQKEEEMLQKDRQGKEKKMDKKVKKKPIEELDMDEDEDDEEMDDLEKELMGEEDSEMDEESGEEMEIDLEGEDEEEDEDQEEEDEEGVVKKKEKEQEIGEDIYGRTVNRQTGELIDFNPRAARMKLAQLEASSVDDEERRKVERAVRGVLNILSESTLVKGSKHLGELFHTHSKNEVKTAFTRTFLKLLSDPFRIQEKIMAAYAALVALMHTTVSSEMSSHLIEAFFVEYVGKLEEAKEKEEGQSTSSFEQEGKAMENRTVFAAHMLSFKIIRGELILELLKKLSKDLDQPRLQLSIVLVKYAFKQLRRTVNTPLTEILQGMNKQLEGRIDEFTTQPRMRFLMEELSDLKKTAMSFDQPELEHLMKIYHGLVKKNTDVERELGMSLDDLLQADERGRWWVVGSAFRLPSDYSKSEAAAGAIGKSSKLNFDSEMIELAKKAGMNTEVRRNVFCSVVSAKSEDDAFERLMRLSLKGSQEREIVHILVTMLLKERSFNPFYAALLRRFAEYHRRFVLTIQFAVWDRFRDLGKLKEKQREHLANLLHSLFLYRALPLTALKVVEWGELSVDMTDCLKRIFAKLADANVAILTKIFECVMDGRKNRLLTDGLRLFLQMNFDGNPAYAKVENLFATWR